MNRPSLTFSDLLERVRAVLPGGLDVYLVGGAVRDALLSRPTHDLDFVFSGDVLGVARRVANALGAAFYPLDEERETARVILFERNGSRQILDFAALRGPDLLSDLRGRDFTINAIAIALEQPRELLDPLGGVADLRAGQLRACSPHSFQDDPLRILRAVRLAGVFGFHILPETQAQMKMAVAGLSRVSSERVRDELIRILDGPQPGTAIRILEILGALGYILPEIVALKGVVQSPPHIWDVWTHTLTVLDKLQAVLNVLAPQHDPESAASLALGLVSIRLGRYREQIHHRLETHLTADRSLLPLLFMAALYHDSGKPQTRSIDENGRIRFLGHERVGAELVKERARRLHLSNDEARYLEVVVRNHLRPRLLAQSGVGPTRRAIYRFFRDTGGVGVDVCLLSLADTLATYGSTLPQDEWASLISVVRDLLEAWWEQPEQTVSPPPLVNGHDLIKTFGLKEGPQIGRLLEAIREAQAEELVKDRHEALELVRQRLMESGRGG